MLWTVESKVSQTQVPRCEQSVSNSQHNCNILCPSQLHLNKGGLH